MANVRQAESTETRQSPLVEAWFAEAVLLEKAGKQSSARRLRNLANKVLHLQAQYKGVKTLVKG